MLLPCLAFSQGGTPWTDIDKQKKDFTGNLTITDRDYEAAELAQYPALEYPATPPIRGVAYRRGVTVTVVWTIQNNHPFLLQGTLNILGARLKSPGPNTESPPGSGNWSNPDEFSTLGYSPVTTSLSLAANGGSLNVTLTFLGVPNHVCLGDLEVKYTMPLVRPTDGAQGENGSKGSFEKFTRLYVVDAQPTGLQAKPWADFLEYTCRWAWGAVGSADLKEKTTRGMHYSNRSAGARVAYNWHTPAYVSYLGSPFTAALRLKRFTEDLDLATPWVYLDCADFSAILARAMEGHGTTPSSKRLEPADLGGFITNKLCPAGTDSSNDANYDSLPFNFHVVVWHGGQTFDATSSYFRDLTGAIYKNPPVFWANALHWQVWASGAWQGLVNGGPRPWVANDITIGIVTW